MGGPKGKNFLRVFFGFVLFNEVPPLRRSQTPKNADKERPYTLLFCANCATQICAKYLKCVKIDTRGFSTKFACFFTQILHFLNFPEIFSSFFPIPPYNGNDLTKYKNAWFVSKGLVCAHTQKQHKWRIVLSLVTVVKGTLKFMTIFVICVKCA